MFNKGESINSVARLIFFGKQGRLNESKIERQFLHKKMLKIVLTIDITWLRLSLEVKIPYHK